MVEHDPCSVFSWDSFRAVKMRLLRHQGALPPLPRSLRQDGMRKRAPARRVSAAREGLQGILVCFLPKLFLGSEGEVTSLLTKPCRGASHGALRVCFSQSFIWRQ